MAKGLDNVQFPKSLQDQWVFNSTGEKLSTLKGLWVVSDSKYTGPVLGQTIGSL